MRLNDQAREEAERGKLLPTPEAKLASSGPDYARAGRAGSGGHDLTTAVHLLPTPLANEAEKAWVGKRESPGQKYLSHVIGEKLLPTPNTMDMLPAREGEAMERQLRRGEGEHASRRSTMGNLREDILQTIDPDVFKRELLPTPKAGDGAMHTPMTSRRPVEKSTHLSTIAMLQAGHLEHRREKNLPTPRATDGTNGGPNQRGSSGDLMLPSAVQQPNWGQYEPAVKRWEAINGEAPAPTELTSKGKHRLNAGFAEWMMGLPAGWVTGETPEQHKGRLRNRLNGEDARPVGMRGSLRQWNPNIKRNDQLRAIGNGVVPQQAIAALADMLQATRNGGFFHAEKSGA